jgi:hypothetical protein
VLAFELVRSILAVELDALMSLGESSGLDDGLFPAEPSPSAEAFPTRDTAHQLICKGMTIVDPEPFDD